MKVKTSELTGLALDWAVAKCEGHIRPDGGTYAGRWQGRVGFAPSTDWTHGGPIIERELIKTRPGYKEGWQAIERKYQDWANPQEWFVYGPTLLIAAMRCYVASKLGDEIDVPEELLK